LDENTCRVRKLLFDLREQMIPVLERSSVDM